MPARLACVKPAASVRSEPGSNSHVEEIDLADHVILRRSLTIDPAALHSATKSVSSKRDPTIGTSLSLVEAKAPTARTNAVRVSLPQIQQCQRPRRTGDPTAIDRTTIRAKTPITRLPDWENRDTGQTIRSAASAVEGV